MLEAKRTEEGASTVSEENKAIMRRIYEEIFNEGKLELADELVAPEMVNNTAPGSPRGPEPVKRLVGMLRGAFPDHHIAIDDMIAEGDKVVMLNTYSGTHEGEFMGIAPTGKRFVQRQVHVMRFADGKAIEHWGLRDDLGQLQQLGVVPPLG
jgi:predicted ester cyclase